MAARYSFISYAPLVPALICYIAFTHYFYGQIGDDGYIYFRYVARAIDGYFGSWSDQVAPAEGYSSPLWFLLLTFFAKLGLNVAVTAKSLGVLFSALALVGTSLLSRALGASRFSAGVACFLLSINAGFYYWSTAGLETPFYIALMVFVALSLVTERYVLLMLALVSVARPEGPFLMIALLISYQLVAVRRLSKTSCCLVCVPFLAWFIWRLTMYELPLPNTFYAKATGNLAEQIIRGFIYCAPILLLWLSCWFVWLKQSDKKIMIVLGVASWLMALIVVGGGDWMLHFRLLLPVLPLLFAVIVAQWNSQMKIKTTILFISLLPLSLLCVFPKDMQLAFLGQSLDKKLYQEGTMTHQSKALAQVIKQRYVEDDLLIAVNHAGALPYWLNDADFIDMVGLNNKMIAQAAGQMHQKYDVDYVFKKKPDLIVLNTRVKPFTNNAVYHPGYWQGETALVNDARFYAHYRYAGISQHWQWRIQQPFVWLYSGFSDSWILVFERIKPS